MFTGSEIKQVISRYYFNVEISVDESNNDKYCLTKYILTNAEAYRNLTYRNIGMLKNVSLEYLRVQKDISERYNISITKPVARALMKEASRMGSVMLIDLVSREDIYQYLYSKLDRIIKEE